MLTCFVCAAMGVGIGQCALQWRKDTSMTHVVEGEIRVKGVGFLWLDVQGVSMSQDKVINKVGEIKIYQL